MELLQQQPSEISLHKDSTRLILQERTNMKWLFSLLGFWAILGTSVSCVLVIEGISTWITALVLTVAFAAEVITLLSWVMYQTCTFDATTKTVTFTQKSLFGKTTSDRRSIQEISNVQLIPKANKNAWSYYISLKLRSGEDVGMRPDKL